MNNNELSIQILTNLDCNLDCTYCYENKNRGMNDPESIKKFIKFMILDGLEKNKIDKSGNITIEYIGGESFLYPNLLDELSQYTISFLKNNGFEYLPIISISTNATLLQNPQVSDFIKKYSKILYIGISLDGNKKCHDKNRIFKNSRKGSYDIVIKNIKYLFTILDKSHISIKATFTKETLPYYEESMIYLISLGIETIMGNFIFEEKFTSDEAISVMFQLKNIIDYIFENNLETKIKLNHLLFPSSESSVRNFNIMYPENSWNVDEITSNFCGSCKYMRCIGFDDKIYGCNRFLTMNKPNMEIGILTENGIKITNQKLIDEVSNQYKRVPRICRECHLHKECSSCAAIPYEFQNFHDVDDFLRERNMCSLTKIYSIIKLYIKQLFIKKYNEKHTEKHNELYDNTDLKKKYIIEKMNKQLFEIIKEMVNEEKNSNKYIKLKNMYLEIENEKKLFISNFKE